MAGLISQARTANSGKKLKKAADANHDPADLGSKAGARLLDIPITEIGYNPRNVRDEDIEKDPETHELAKSLTLLGQLQAAVVVPREAYLKRYPDEEGNVTTPWVVMLGNRRRAGAKLNGWTVLECIVRDRVTKELEFDDIPIHENLHRKGINPLTMAYYLADKKKKLRTERAVAEVVGKTQPWVNQHLSLLKLIPELQAVVKAKELTATAGRSLARLDHDDQRVIWERVAELPAEERAEFWAGGYWRLDKSFINPEGATEVSGDSPGEPADEAAEDEPRPEPVARSPREKPAIVIRVTERSPRLLADALREHLSGEEIKELVHALED